jgi:hypothetical protein
MTYAYTMDVGQPIEMYERVREELEHQLGRTIPQGCLVHLVTRTDSGFRVTEVWESHEAADRFGDEIMRPLISRVTGRTDAELAQNPPASEELHVHRLEIDTAALATSG